MNTTSQEELNAIIASLESGADQEIGLSVTVLDERENGTTDELRSAIEDTARFEAFLTKAGL